MLSFLKINITLPINDRNGMHFENKWENLMEHIVLRERNRFFLE